MELHAARHVEVDPAGVPDGGVVVDPEGGRPCVVGGHADGLGLVYEHVGHPDDVGLAGVEGEVGADGVLAVEVLGQGPDTGVLHTHREITG